MEPVYFFLIFHRLYRDWNMCPEAVFDVRMGSNVL